MLLRALAAHPDDEALMMEIGRAYLRRGECRRALQYVKRAVQAGAKGTEPVALQAACYYQEGDLARARILLEQALEEEPRKPSLYNDLGVVLAEQGEWQSAEAAYRRALELNPKEATARCNLGIALRQLGREQEAAEMFEAALASDPNCVTAHYCLGLHQGARGAVQVGAVAKVGALMRLGPELSLKEHSEGIYSTRVEEVSEGGIVVQAPARHGAIVPLRPGMRLLLATPTDDGLYVVTTRVLERRSGPIPTLVLENPFSPAARVQRRRFYRVSSRLVERVRVIGRRGGQELSTLRGEIRDRNVSMGGVLISSVRPLPRNALVEVTLGLPGGPMRVAGEVMRVTRRDDGRFELGLRFLGLNEKQRKAINRYVYERQVDLRKKGA